MSNATPVRGGFIVPGAWDKTKLAKAQQEHADLKRVGGLDLHAGEN